MPISKELESSIKTAVETMEGWCTPEKAVMLANLVADRKPKLCVELGIFGGRSIIPMALALKETQCGVIYGIDPWSVDAALEGDNDPANNQWWTNNVNLEDIYLRFVHEVLKYQVQKECRWVRMRSDEIVDAFKDGSIELLHQDSNHSEEVSCREVDMWSVKLAPNAVWILDDADWFTQRNAIERIKNLGFKLTMDFVKYHVYER